MNPIIRKRSLVFGLLCLFVLFVLALTFYLAQRASPYQAVHRADGTTIELLGYSYGRQHELRMRQSTTGIEGFLSLLHPAPILKAARTEQNALVVWLRVPHQLDLHPGNFPPFVVVPSDGGSSVYPVDTGRSLEINFTTGRQYSSMVSMSQNVISTQWDENIGLVLPAYPRSKSRFRLEVM